MAVIRQSDAVRMAEEAIALDLGDLKRQGDALVARAREQAAAIIAQAHSERERIMRGIEEQARAEGRAAGEREGRDAGRKAGHDAGLRERRAQLEALERAWTQALADFESRRSTMLQEAREDVLTLAVMLAERVVRRQLAVDPSVVGEFMEACLRAVAKPTALTLTVAKQDEALARAALPAVLARVATAHSVTLVVDERAAGGTCVAKTAGGGVVDASVEAQLERIAAALVPSRAEEQSP